MDVVYRYVNDDPPSMWRRCDHCGERIGHAGEVSRVIQDGCTAAVVHAACESAALSA